MIMMNCFGFCTVEKMMFSITDFFRKFDEIRKEMRVWSLVFVEIRDGKLHLFSAS